jgi:uncharacterized protein
MIYDSFSDIFAQNILEKLQNALLLIIFLSSCQQPQQQVVSPEGISIQRDSLPQPDSFGLRLAAAALELTKVDVTYDGSYVVIPYPNGDVPAHTGVCTDVVIRAYRKVGIDLQKEVHEDMKANFAQYPKTWGLKKPDTNIDHRRVPNLGRFFERKGATLSISTSGEAYTPGDVVTWVLQNGLTHIGIVSNEASADGKQYKIVHNIGAGQVLEDVLFAYTITGHYRYKK